MIIKDGYASNMPIKDVIKEAGFTQKEIAEQLGVTPVTLCRWCKDEPRATREYAVLHAIMDLSEKRSHQRQQEKWAKAQREKAVTTGMNTEERMPTRELIRRSGFHQWKIAEQMGIGENTLCRWLRHEPDDMRRTAIIQAIHELMEERRKA